ncbi:MAG: Uma2 family endonuclease, partial [Methanosarcinales archaeon]
KLYAKYGVKEYWIIDYRKAEIEVMVLGESGFKTVKKYRKDETLESPLIKGLRIDLKEVF